MLDSFVIADSHPVPDPIGWAVAHPQVLGAGFQALAVRLPHSRGAEIPLVGFVEGGQIVVVAPVELPEESALLQISRSVGFVRTQAAWFTRRFPDRNLLGFTSPHLTLIGAEFSAGFLESLDGLSVGRISLLRVRSVVSTEGTRMVLVEPEQRPGRALRVAASPPGFTDEERRFFRQVEEDHAAFLHRHAAP